MHRMGTRGRAFTLVELLVVIAIIGILMAMVLPAIQSSRESGRRTQCLNNMRNVGIGFQRYFERSKRMPAASAYNYRTAGTSKTTNHGWAVQLLPFIEEEATYRRMDLRQNWDAAINKPVAATLIPVFLCATVPDTDTQIHFNAVNNLQQARIDYTTFEEVLQWIYDKNPGIPANAKPESTAYASRAGALDKTIEVPLAKYYDGLSKTLMLTECSGRPSIYRDGGRFTETSPSYSDGCNHARISGYVVGSGWADFENTNELKGMNADGAACDKPVCIMNCTNNNEPFGFHPAGITAVMVDGSSKFLGDNTEIGVFAAMMTRAGGEQVQIPE